MTCLRKVYDLLTVKLVPTPALGTRDDDGGHAGRRHPEILDPGQEGPARTAVVVDPAERVFAGHYPGSPSTPACASWSTCATARWPRCRRPGGGPWPPSRAPVPRPGVPRRPADHRTALVAGGRGVALPGADVHRARPGRKRPTAVRDTGIARGGGDTAGGDAA
ncbi:hypothetical protein NKH77_20415 [Streptomyces sp. M19]